MSERRGPAPGGLDMESLLHALRKERRTFLGFLAASLLAAGVGSALTPRQYQAGALIQLLPRAGQEVRVDAVVKHDEAGYLESRDRARTQIQIILSRSIRAETLRRYAVLRDKDPGGPGLGDTSLGPDDASIDALGAALSVLPRENTELVEIKVLHADPQVAARLADLVTDAYADENLSSRRDAARQTQVWLEGHTDEYKATLDDATAKVLDFQAANDLVDIDQKVDGIGARLSALQKAAGDAATERVLLEGKLSEHRQMLAKGQFDVLTGMFDDPTLATMAKERATVVTESAEVLSRYGEQHPDHIRAVERIKRVDQQIADEVRRNVEGEVSMLDALRRQEREINAEVEKVKAELFEKERLQRQYNDLKLDEERARKLFGSLGERGAEVDLQAQTRLNDVRVVDRAVPPKRPAKPNIPLNMGVALLIGLVGGGALAWWRHRGSEAILNGADVERHLDLPLLGEIPRLPDDTPKAAIDLYSFEHPRSLEAEAFRAVRAAIHAPVTGDKPRKIVVTSTMEDEGKSHVAIGLAVAFAQLGLRTLLVDGDLRLPRLHKVFGLPDSPGLADCLIGDDGPPSYAVPTQVQRLHLLRAGVGVEYPNEFLASPEVGALVDRLGKLYDAVVIDTPPSALVSDAAALARHADGVVVVVRQGHVPRRHIRRAIDQLRGMGGKLLGVALNAVPRRAGEDAYGSRYYDEKRRRAART